MDLVIDGYRYYYFIDDDLQTKYENFIKIYQNNNDIEFHSHCIAFWIALERIFYESMSEYTEEVCTKLSMIYNIKSNMLYITVNRFDESECKSIIDRVKELCDEESVYQSLDTVKRNTECYSCNKKLYCKCGSYYKRIPFSLCRFNKLVGDGIRSEKINDRLIHFCSIDCETEYYNNNISNKKTD
jgi:hypothetical protein